MSDRTTAPAGASTPGTLGTNKVHFLESIVIPISGGMGAESKSFGRGDELVLSTEVIEAGRDRFGGSWLDALHDEAAQVERYGAVAFRPGPWPGGPTWRRGDRDWADARERARQAAWAIDDPVQRGEAHAAVEREYGPATTSRTLSGLRDAR